MRICCVEDEIAQGELLKKRILAWGESNNIQVNMDIYKSANEYLFNADKCAYDLIFLDIRMDDINGMELARQIREKDKDVLLVFVTSERGFVFEGYEVNAYRYIIKPISDEKLADVLEYAKNNAVRDEGSIVLKVDNETIRIMRNDIAYIEVKGHYVDIHTMSDIITHKTSFEDIMELLNENSVFFIKTHRSYAVNIDKILKIGRTEVTLITKETVPVSKSMYQPVNKAFIKYNLGDK
ncbi:MAG: LytTR family DNA-binding domain-containing protein [Lachnospiraceae bacterium]|nr:LytTR family DNA-binding domain-containing protein [Lachnospiraceae bacterium]